MKVKSFYEPNFREWKENDNIYPPIRSAGGTMGNGSEGIIVTYEDTENELKAFAMQRIDEYKESESASSIKARDYKDSTDLIVEEGDSMNAGQTKSIVRRLTPLECERLQGFPDEWTNLGDWTDESGKVHKYADTPRYKALGNSIALPFWQYLARRIVAQYEHEVTMGSLFSGIGGFELVFSRCGAEPLWSSEIEPFCQAVLRERFPE